MKQTLKTQRTSFSHVLISDYNILQKIFEYICIFHQPAFCLEIN
jgi:hypothetical protein